jgi:hypothetical protein
LSKVPTPTGWQQYRPAVDSGDTAALIAVCGTIGGTIAGSGLTWLQSTGQSRHAQAAARDEQFTAISSECADLINQVRLWRSQTSVSVRAMRGNDLLAIERQIMANSVRLSMCDSIPFKHAIRWVSDAVRDFIDLADQPGYTERETELRAALVQLRNARDLAASTWWQPGRRRYFRAQIRNAPVEIQAIKSEPPTG